MSFGKMSHVYIFFGVACHQPVSFQQQCLPGSFIQKSCEAQRCLGYTQKISRDSLRTVGKGAPKGLLWVQSPGYASFNACGLLLSTPGHSALMPVPLALASSYASADQQKILPFSSPTKSLVWFLVTARAVTAGLALLGLPLKATLTSSSRLKARFLAHL